MVNRNYILSIIIVNFNTAKFISRCLDSIRTNLSELNLEVTIVDNASPEREIEDLVSLYPEVKFLMRSENDGFGGGCNFAADKANGDLLLFLNPDTLLTDSSILKLVGYLLNHPQAGIVSGLLVNDAGEPMYCFNSFPSLKWELYQTIGIGYMNEISKMLGRPEITAGEPFETDWFHGAFLMMRKADFNRAGGFDNRYFMYYEDTELCYAFKRKLKFRNICLPDVRIKHSTQSSLEGESIDNIRNFHMHRGKLIFIENYGAIKRMAFWLLGILNVSSRIILLPLWKKFSGQRKEKFSQLCNIARLYLSNDFLENSKFKYISK